MVTINWWRSHPRDAAVVVDVAAVVVVVIVVLDVVKVVVYVHTAVVTAHVDVAFILFLILIML